MAHFAKVNENNIVEQVVVVPDEQEHRGAEYLNDDLGMDGRWIQTSYNHKIRNRFAGVGMIYDEQADVFHSPQIYKKWTLNRETWNWEPPTDYPGEGWCWDETIEDWVKIAETL